MDCGPKASGRCATRRCRGATIATWRSPAPASGRGVPALESQVCDSRLDAIVLRYGRLYGPCTWTDRPNGPAPLHADAAAHAALLALDRGSTGLYNIAEDDGHVSIAKARRELGFDPGFRIGR